MAMERVEEGAARVGDGKGRRRRTKNNGVPYRRPLNSVFLLRTYFPDQTTN